MTEMTPTDHELNECLAEVAGERIAWVEERNSYSEHWSCVEMAGEEEALTVEWDALTDAKQMQLVKAGLQQQGKRWRVTYDGTGYRAEIWNPSPLMNSSNAWECKDIKDELRALALARWGMRHA